MNSLGGIENMKKHASLHWSLLVSLITTAVSVGLPLNRAWAQSNNVPVTPSPTVSVSTNDTQAPPLAFGVSEVVKMYQGGISKEVIVSYIENTVLPFHLTADGIIYLQHLGVPQEVTSALIRRDGELQKQAMAAYQQQQQAMATAPGTQAAPGNTAPPAQPAVTMPGTLPPSVSPYPDTTGVAPPVVYPDYGPYPYYGYPYYYGPDVVIAGGWGWGWGPHGWGWGPGRGGFDHGGFGGHGGFGHR
jgi:hypothetical protein